MKDMYFGERTSIVSMHDIGFSQEEMELLSKTARGVLAPVEEAISGFDKDRYFSKKGNACLPYLHDADLEINEKPEDQMSAEELKTIFYAREMYPGLYKEKNLFGDGGYTNHSSYGAVQKTMPSGNERYCLNQMDFGSNQFCIALSQAKLSEDVSRGTVFAHTRSYLDINLTARQMAELSTSGAEETLIYCSITSSSVYGFNDETPNLRLINPFVARQGASWASEIEAVTEPLLLAASNLVSILEKPISKKAEHQELVDGIKAYLKAMEDVATPLKETIDAQQRETLDLELKNFNKEIAQRLDHLKIENREEILLKIEKLGG